MSGYKNFAVIGSASVGKHIIEALLEKKNAGIVSSVSILNMPFFQSGGLEDFIVKGAKRVTVDYSSESSIKAAFAGIDVAISVVNNAALELQVELAKVAKDAGVKLFVPSEWGAPSGDAGFFATKNKVNTSLRDIGLPYSIFYTGAWTDWHFEEKVAKALGFDFVNRKADIHGSGTADISYVARHDVGRYVAYVLTTLPRDKLEWRTFRIEGERTNWNRIVADWGKRTGKKLAISHHPRSEYEEALAKNPNDFIAIISLGFDEGKGVVGKPEEVSNNEWPDWKPQKVVDTLVEIYGKNRGL